MERQNIQIKASAKADVLKDMTYSETPELETVFKQRITSVNSIKNKLKSLLRVVHIYIYVISVATSY